MVAAVVAERQWRYQLDLSESKLCTAAVCCESCDNCGMWNGVLRLSATVGAVSYVLYQTQISSLTQDKATTASTQAETEM